MKEIDLHIKNMVCARCIKVVSDELKTLGAEILHIELGYASIILPDERMDIDRISEVLDKEGFKLLDDKDTVLVEDIKINLIKYLALIENEEYKAVSLSEFLTRKIGKNYSLLSKHFSKHYHKTIERHFIDIKIERVKELLDYNELTLSEISIRLRYSSVSYLSSQFKKITGRSASNYRKGKHTRNPLDAV